MVKDKISVGCRLVTQNYPIWSEGCASESESDSDLGEKDNIVDLNFFLAYPLDGDSYLLNLFRFFSLVNCDPDQNAWTSSK